MPNHITNMLSFDKVEDFEKVAEYMKSKSREFDFNNLVKMPEDLNFKNVTLLIESEITGESTLPLNVKQLREKYKDNPDDLEKVKKYVHNYLTHGYISWDDWSRKFWGTKRNAYSIIINTKDKVILFNTAYKGVHVLMELLSVVTNTEMLYMYAEEGKGSEVGFTHYVKGCTEHNEYIEAYSDRAYSIYNTIEEQKEKAQEEQKENGTNKTTLL